MGSPHSIITLIGHDREAGRPLTPEQIKAGVKTTIPFTINNGMVADDPDSFLLWIDQVSSSGIAITLAAISFNMASDGLSKAMARRGTARDD